VPMLLLPPWDSAKLWFLFEYQTMCHYALFNVPDLMSFSYLQALWILSCLRPNYFSKKSEYIRVRNTKSHSPSKRRARARSWCMRPALSYAALSSATIRA
jgi:hypothetical protein